MKSIMVVALVALGLSPLTGFAAQQGTINEAQRPQVIAVNATGSTSLMPLESQLSGKANAAGAKSYRMISTSGSNSLYGTATVYN